MTKQRLAAVGWIAIATAVLLYAPMAIEFTARFFGGGPQLWDHVFTQAVGADRATGPGSIHGDQQEVYSAHRWVLLTHTVLGGIAILLAVVQISRRSRLRISVHRWIGRTQVTIALVAMGGAMAFLLLVGPDGTFDGPAFFVQLWALAIGTVAGTALGWVAIRRGHTSSHRILMVYAFALLCTAPFLRLLYLVLGIAWPETSQQVTNLAGGAIEGVWAPMAAILASRMVPVGRRRDHLSPLPGAWLDRAVLIAAALTLAGLVVTHARLFDGVDRITLTAATAYLLGLALTSLNLRASRSGGDTVAAEEWRIHHNALLLGLPATAVLWLAYTLWFTAGESYYGALLTGPPVPLSLGLLAVAWRRRTPARRNAEELAAA